MILTPLQIFEVARKATFPSVVAVTMTAIALRESAGDPAAFNNTPGTGDRSYGLWQIDMMSAGVATAVNRWVLKGEPETGLFDPATNAAAAFILWDHKNHNLDVAWYIAHNNADGTPTAYRTRYESHLPAAQAAALQSSLA
jgi:hypothetical protein